MKNNLPEWYQPKIKSRTARVFLAVIRAALCVAAFYYATTLIEMRIFFDIHETGHLIASWYDGIDAERVNFAMVRADEYNIQNMIWGHGAEVLVTSILFIVLLGICNGEYWICGFALGLATTCFLHWYGSPDSRVILDYGVNADLPYTVIFGAMIGLDWMLFIRCKLRAELVYIRDGVRPNGWRKPNGRWVWDDTPTPPQVFVNTKLW